MISRIGNALQWLRVRSDFTILLAAFAVVAAVWTFVALVDEVQEGDTRQFDEIVLQSLRNPTNPADPVGPSWVEEAVRDIAALGGVMDLVLIIAAVAGYLVLRKQYRALLFLLVAVFGGVLINWTLKVAIDRPRPTVVPHLVEIHTPSFPSGHSFMSAVVYLTLGALLSRLVEQRVLKIYFVTVALAFTFLVGFSRVYIGVHYPSDVLAGWCGGLAWAAGCWLVARYLQSRGAVEQPGEE